MSGEDGNDAKRRRLDEEGDAAIVNDAAGNTVKTDPEAGVPSLDAPPAANDGPAQQPGAASVAPAATAAAAAAPGGVSDMARSGGTACFLNVPGRWAQKEFSDWLREAGAPFTSCAKRPGQFMGFATFSTVADREEAEKQCVGQKLTGCKWPVKVEEPMRGKGAKGKAAPSAPSGPLDLRDSVSPLWRQSYPEQLVTKRKKVEEALRGLTKDMMEVYGVSEGKGKGGRGRGKGDDANDAYDDPPSSSSDSLPAWLAEARKRKDKLAVPLKGIIRSPQLFGYRNKTEFSVGFGLDGAPTVGFLLGSFREGMAGVAEPTDCPNISKTAKAFGRLFQEYLRSGATKLPAWDKRTNTGFWRILTVREGRSEGTYLPTPDMKAEEGAASFAAAPAPVEAHFGSLDWQRWLVEGDPRVSAVARGGPSDVPDAPPATDEVLLLLQCNDKFGAGDKEALDAEVVAAAHHLAAEAARLGLPRIGCLMAQWHSGMANAAPPDAPTLPVRLPGMPEPAPTTIVDTLLDKRFRVSAQAFFQVNSGAASLLYSAAGDWAMGRGADGPAGTSASAEGAAEGTEGAAAAAAAAPAAAAPRRVHLLDVCCGTGTIGITLADHVHRVTGIDIVESAIEDAGSNAALNGLGKDRCSYVCGKAEDVLGPMLSKLTAPKEAAAGPHEEEELVAIVDPPRNGLHPGVLKALLSCPSLKRLVYVSCNPATLQQNAAELCTPRHLYTRAKHVPKADYVPFRPVCALACDLFPHSDHCEAILLLERD